MIHLNHPPGSNSRFGGVFYLTDLLPLVLVTFFPPFSSPFVNCPSSSIIFCNPEGSCPFFSVCFCKPEGSSPACRPEFSFAVVLLGFAFGLSSCLARVSG